MPTWKTADIYAEVVDAAYVVMTQNQGWNDTLHHVTVHIAMQRSRYDTYRDTEYTD